MRVFKSGLALALAVSLFAPLAPADANGRGPLRITVSVSASTSLNNSDTAGNCSDAPNYRGQGGLLTAVANSVDGDTIVICGSTSVLNLPGTVVVTKPLTIEGITGPSSIPTVGVTAERVFQINTTGKVIIRNLTLDGSTLPAGQNGGAILLSGGDLDLIDVEVTGSAAPSSGGGLAVINTLGASNVQVQGSTFHNNSATSNGGAIYFASPSGSLSVVNSTFYKNSAAAGAAVFSLAGTASVDFSTAVNNTGAGGSFRGITLGSSIVANHDNSAACGSSVDSSGSNLVTDSSCTWAGAYPTEVGGSSLVTLSQLLLGRFGGRTGENNGIPTIRPTKDSVAVGFAANSPIQVDAAGRNRPLGADGKFDAGAIERPAGLNEWNIGRRLSYANPYIHWPTLNGADVNAAKTVLFSPTGAGATYASLSPTICSVGEFNARISFLAEGECRVESHIPRAVSGENTYEEWVDVVSVTARTFSKPSVPQNVVITPGNKQFRVTWNAPASNGGAPVVSYSVLADPEVPLVPITEIKNCNSPCIVKGNASNPALSRPLVNGAAYKIRIKVTNAAGLTDDFVVSGIVRPLAPVLPSKPLFVSVIAGKGTATIRWANPDEPGRTAIKNYEIRAFLKSAPTKVLKKSKVGGNVYKFTMSGLPKGKAVIFRVFAINSGGASPSSNPVTVTIKR